MAKKKQRRDIYQEVTDQILATLDAGVVPWRNPIRRGSSNGWPKNLNTGKPYRGINVFLLATMAMAKGYDSDYWLTYKQASGRGGKVRRGEKSSLVVFWKQASAEDRETGEEIAIPVLRHYNVFNVQQCEDVVIPDAVDESQLNQEFEPLAKAVSIVDSYDNAPEIEHGGNRAVYRPLADRVLIAEPKRFETTESYYATLFHELVHSTGHSSRLNRGLDVNLTEFGSPDYSKEELVAEMGAAFLAAVAGISPSTIDQSASYIEGWRKQLGSDKRLVISAASAAQKAADWILGTKFDDAATDEVNSETAARQSKEASQPQMGATSERALKDAPSQNCSKENERDDPRSEKRQLDLF